MKFAAFLLAGVFALCVIPSTAEAKFCPACGKRNGEINAFCIGCGKSIMEARNPAPKPVPREVDICDEGCEVDFTPTGGLHTRASDRILTDAELSRLSSGELSLIRNEIYARHGWIFDRRDLAEHFARMAWYRPAGPRSARSAVNARVERSLSAIERRNIDLIKRYERR